MTIYEQAEQHEAYIRSLMQELRLTEEQAYRYDEVQHTAMSAMPGLAYHLRSTSNQIGMCRDIMADAIARWIRAGEPDRLEYEALDAARESDPR